MHGYLLLHVRTITVATHPRTKLDERDIVGETLVDPDVLQSSVHTTQKLGDTLPYGLVDVAHPVTHFVLWGRLCSPDLISSEGCLDLYVREEPTYISNSALS